jgi:hypothetical protein
VIAIVQQPGVGREQVIGDLLCTKDKRVTIQKVQFVSALVEKGDIVPAAAIRSSTVHYDGIGFTPDWDCGDERQRVRFNGERCPFLGST